MHTLFLGQKAEAIGAISTLAERPNLQSGKFSQHVDKILMGGSPESQNHYRLLVPGHSRHDNSRVETPLAFKPPLECLVERYEEQGGALNETLNNAIENDQLPPIYHRSPVVQNAPIVAPAFPILLFFLMGLDSHERTLPFAFGCLAF